MPCRCGPHLHSTWPTRGGGTWSGAQRHRAAARRRTPTAAAPRRHRSIDRSRATPAHRAEAREVRRRYATSRRTMHCSSRRRAAQDERSRRDACGFALLCGAVPIGPIRAAMPRQARQCRAAPGSLSPRRHCATAPFPRPTNPTDLVHAPTSCPRQHGVPKPSRTIFDRSSSSRDNRSPPRALARWRAQIAEPRPLSLQVYSKAPARHQWMVDRCGAQLLGRRLQGQPETPTGDSSARQAADTVQMASCSSKSPIG